MEMRLDLDQVGFNKFNLGAGETDFTHTHDHFQLSIPLNGSIQIHYNHAWRTIQPDEGLVVAPGDTHQHEALGSRAEILLVSVRQGILERVMRDRLEQSFETFDSAPWQKVSMSSLIQMAKRAYQTAAFEGIEECSDIEWELASHFLDTQTGSHTQLWQQKQFGDLDQPLVRRAIEFIREHYTENLSLDILAKNLNVSKYYVHRSFKRATGRTPLEFIHHVRLERAGQLIRTQQIDSTAVAYEVGYQSVSTFHRAFKKYYQMSPFDYKKRIM